MSLLTDLLHNSKIESFWNHEYLDFDIYKYTLRRNNILINFDCTKRLFSALYFILTILLVLFKETELTGYIYIHIYMYICIYMKIFPSGLVVKNPRAMQELQKLWVQSSGQEDPLVKEMATQSSILAWKILWTEEPGGLQSMGSQRVEHDWASIHCASSDKYMWRNIYEEIYYKKLAHVITKDKSSPNQQLVNWRPKSTDV